MKLLIIDDDIIARNALRESIGPVEGWEIVEAEDGQEALDRLCDGLRADLVIVDLNMPRMGGLELIQRLRRDLHLRGLKVVVSSSARDRDTIVELAKLKISGYLLKPYDAGRTQALLQPLMPPASDARTRIRNLLSPT
jgi:two-component system, chemotaxis family, chemotaxis protein CheY